MIGRAHVSCFVVLVVVLPDVAKHQRGDGNDHHQHPRAHDHPPHDLHGDEGGRPPRQHHRHEPVHAHQHDQEDGGVHVGVAQVEQAFAHDVAEDPRLLGQVDDEEDGDGHERAVGERQVEDEEGGDRASSGASQDAPDDEDVAGDAHEEDQAEDEGAQGGGEVVAHHAVIFHVRVIGGGGEEGADGVGHAGRRFFDPEETKRQSRNLNKQSNTNASYDAGSRGALCRLYETHQAHTLSGSEKILHTPGEVFMFNKHRTFNLTHSCLCPRVSG